MYRFLLSICLCASSWVTHGSPLDLKSTVDTCAGIKVPEFPGLQVLSVVTATHKNLTVPADPMYTDDPFVNNINVCDVNVTFTHIGDNDTVLVEVWLPLDSADWNGRFHASGGGGYSAGNYGDAYGYTLSQPVTHGYATAMTDAGHPFNLSYSSSWSLKPDGEVDQVLLQDFASRSIHDLAVVSKAVITSYYGRGPDFSYWFGCSGGGRQGFVAAQQYPTDYHGIIANAPAIYWPQLFPAIYWGQLVMNNEGYFPTQCEFWAFFNASITQCDTLDGVKDGVISYPEACIFDPYPLVGTTVACGDGTEVTLTQAAANIVQRLFDGPTTTDGRFLWYGLLKGTPFYTQANTTTINGTVVGVPFTLGPDWIKQFLKKDPNFDVTTLTYNDYSELFVQSVVEYTPVIGSHNPDLSEFHAAGGKLISWHGLADTAIPAQASIRYRLEVEALLGGSASVNEFFRLFMVPGAVHCIPGAGPAPSHDDVLSAIRAWVEEGVAPETLPAYKVDSKGAAISRDICPFPLVSRYSGQGDPNLAESYSCEW